MWLVAPIIKLNTWFSIETTLNDVNAYRWTSEPPSCNVRKYNFIEINGRFCCRWHYPETPSSYLLCVSLDIGYPNTNTKPRSALRTPIYYNFFFLVQKICLSSHATTVAISQLSKSQKSLKIGFCRSNTEMPIFQYFRPVCTLGYQSLYEIFFYEVFVTHSYKIFCR